MLATERIEVGFDFLPDGIESLRGNTGRGSHSFLHCRGLWFPFQLTETNLAALLYRLRLTCLNPVALPFEWIYGQGNLVTRSFARHVYGIGFNIAFRHARKFLAHLTNRRRREYDRMLETVPALSGRVTEVSQRDIRMSCEIVR